MTARKHSQAPGWAAALAAAIAVTAALGPPPAQAQTDAPKSAAATIKTWESAEERLTMLLAQVPEQARKGIEQALEANREGRRNAQEALRRGDEQRAQRALEIASAQAEAGLDQARAQVPEHVLPQLDDAAARMSARRAASVSGLTAAPNVAVEPANRPTFERPGAAVPGGMNPAGSPGRPVTPPRRP